MATINLAASLKKASETRLQSVFEFRHGIRLRLNFMSKARFRAIADKTTETVYDPNAKERVTRPNSKRFLEEFVKEAVADWEGVTLTSVSKIAPIDLEGYTAEQMVEAIPFSREAAYELISGAYDLDTFVQNTVVDVSAFRPNVQDEVKNSETTQSGA